MPLFFVVPEHSFGSDTNLTSSQLRVPFFLRVPVFLACPRFSCVSPFFLRVPVFLAVSPFSFWLRDFTRQARELNASLLFVTCQDEKFTLEGLISVYYKSDFRNPLVNLACPRFPFPVFFSLLAKVGCPRFPPFPPSPFPPGSCL